MCAYCKCEFEIQGSDKKIIFVQVYFKNVLKNTFEKEWEEENIFHSSPKLTKNKFNFLILNHTVKCLLDQNNN